MDPLLKLVLDPPPISTTIHYPQFEVEVLRKIIRAKWKARSKTEDIEDDLGTLADEFKLLSHILYKNHNRFRNDKGYKDLRMLEKTLQKFLNHKFLKNLIDFLGFIPDSPSSHLKTYLPSQAMGFHTQLQLYGAGAFLARIEMLSKNCALLDVQRLNLGHFWGVSAQNLAVVGRIWLVCRHVVVGVQTCYDGLGQLLAELPGDRSREMPSDLFAFMPEDIVKQVKQAEAVIVDIESSVLAKEQTVTVDDFLDMGEPVKRTVDLYCDIGEKIKQPKLDPNNDLSALNKMRKNEVADNSKAAESTTAKDILSEIHSIDQLKDFLRGETESRKVLRKSSFTHKLSQDEWKSLKKEVLTNLMPTKPNKSLKLCRKLIRDAVK
eukprot:TRINITY_DN22753_c0_g1_i1.p1 TRINITY_DN22753_c0_g1~~TRINITY_DN22753_c0_g1_i1.p1  ORF type:complete len:390 (+),score=108.14 TRINITY_DN22753_c0_g1_i1:37-1170(+)